MLLTCASSSVVPAPFDAIADEYDEIFTHSHTGSAQRSLVHDAMRPYFGDGDHILELNCGTGEDAIQLATRGISVYACDASKRMIDVGRRKLALREDSLPVTFAVHTNEDLGELGPASRFDGALSNFGGLNCTEDLASAARQIADLVHAGGQFFLCLLGRHCAWETVWYGIRGRWRKAMRRRKAGGTVASIGGNRVRVFYPSVRDVRTAFAPAFRLEEWCGIGVTVPPSWMEPVFRDHPGVIRRLAGIDRRLGRLPVLRSAGDHVLYRFVREA